MKTKNLLLVALLMLLSVSAFAQTRFSLHAGGAFPMGDFKDGNLDKWALDSQGNRKACAGIGFDLGMKLTIPVGDIGLGVTISGDYFYNGYNSDLRDDLDEFIEDLEEYDDYSLSKPRFMNIPILLGLNYTYYVSDMFAIFGEAAVGPNIRMISKYEIYCIYEGYFEDYYGDIHYDEFEYDYKCNFKSAVTFGFQVGGGILINDVFSIGLNYYNLGSADVKGDQVINGDDYKFKGKKVSCSNLALRLGVHF